MKDLLVPFTQVMTMKNNFQALLQCFFVDRLISQQQVSPDTVRSYRDTFRILLKYLRDEKNISSTCLTFEMLDVTLIIDFLKYLKETRGNSNKTVNNRLAAIHSFFQYVSYENPEHISIIQKVMKIPFKRIEKKTVDFLTEEEMTLLVNSCDSSNFQGRRDRLIVVLLYNTGMRVSELVSLKRRDVHLDASQSGTIHIFGKGRKERIIPIWKITSSYLREYFKENSFRNDDYIFVSTKGGQMTRSGVRYRLDLLLDKASQSCSTFSVKKLTPHTLRHTTAIRLLQSGVDLSTIAIWLGHENVNTTHQYMEADLRLKEKALSQTKEPTTENYFYKPSKDILSFLDSL